MSAALTTTPFIAGDIVDSPKFTLFTRVSGYLTGIAVRRLNKDDDLFKNGGFGLIN